MKNGAAQNESYEFGDFRLDLEEHLLKRGDGTAVPLTPRVFETLRYLVDHRGRVADKQAIMEAVWPDCIVEENNLAQNISTLRRIFGDTPGSQQYIVTVPGRGYRFVPEVKTMEGEKEAPNSRLTTAPPDRLLEPSVQAEPSRPLLGRNLLLFFITALLILCAVASFRWLQTAVRSPAQPEFPLDDKGIAVLSFANLSPDPENAYFADGIKDEILTRLSKFDELKVISRTSSERFKNLPSNLRQIARELGVANILEGSVQKSAETVRVTVQLIHAPSDTHLWAETYDRKLINIFEVESDVAEKVASALHVKLAGREKREASSVGTTNPEAYENYLRGLTAEQPFDYNSWQVAIHALEGAVRLDPQFAKAWALLARVRARTCFQGFDTTEAARLAARKAVETGIRLDPDLVEAKIARGFYEYYVLNDYEAARRIFEQARSQWHNNADIVATLGFIAFRQGKWKEGRDYLDDAIALSPRDCFFREEAAYTRACVRDFPAALRAIDQALAICPDETNLTGIKAAIYQVMGDLEHADGLLRGLHPRANDIPALAAIAQQAMLRRDPTEAISRLRSLRDSFDSLPQLSNARCRLLLAQLESLSGNATEAQAGFAQARELLENEHKQQPQNALQASLLSQTLTGLGEQDAALREADRAVGLFPSSADARDGPYYEAMRARIQARFGDSDRAIPALERLLETSYSAWPGSLITPVVLRLDPDFDQLRSDPRFQKLCEEKSD